MFVVTRRERSSLRILKWINLRFKIIAEDFVALGKLFYKGGNGRYGKAPQTKKFYFFN